MRLQFLDFELSEDGDGLCTWDALASPSPIHTRALLAEVQALLAHLQKQLGTAGPVDEGHDWDMDLQIHGEAGQTLPLEAGNLPTQRVTLALSLTGKEALAGSLAGWLHS